MPEMSVRRPLRKFDLSTSSDRSQIQFFISSYVSAHCVRFFSGKFANGQAAVSSPFSLLHTSRLSAAQTLSHLDRKHQLVAVLVANDQRIQRVVWRVAADCFVDSFVLEPSAGSLPIS